MARSSAPLNARPWLSSYRAVRALVVALILVSAPASARADDEDLRVALQVSLGPTALGRASGDLLLRVHDRHAAIVSVHATAFHPEPWVRVPTSRGGEVGWRWYAGGPLYGIFVGAVARVVRVSSALEESAVHYGPAFDVGWQSVELEKWTLSAGLGVQWMLGRSIGSEGVAQLVDAPGPRPRMLLNVGRFF